MTPGLVVVLDEWLAPGDPESRLRQKRQRTWYAAKALVEAVTLENRDFTREELDLWDLIMEELTRLDRRLVRILVA